MTAKLFTFEIRDPATKKVVAKISHRSMESADRELAAWASGGFICTRV